MKKFVVVLSVDDDVEGSKLHEALCLILHEGHCFDDAGLRSDWLENIQVLNDPIDPNPDA
jgi:hypothetical protein